MVTGYIGQIVVFPGISAVLWHIEGFLGWLCWYLGLYVPFSGHLWHPEVISGHIGCFVAF